MMECIVRISLLVWMLGLLQGPLVAVAKTTGDREFEFSGNELFYSAGHKSKKKSKDIGLKLENSISQFDFSNFILLFRRKQDKMNVCVYICVIFHPSKPMNQILWSFFFFLFFFLGTYKILQRLSNVRQEFPSLHFFYN